MSVKKKNRPNILLLFSDQHNARAMACSGNPDVLTPNLDRLAAEGVLFNRAYCQNAICGPSRNSIFTGQYCRTLGILDNAVPMNNPDAFIALTKMLHDNSYRTGSFGKSHLDQAIGHSWDV